MDRASRLIERDRIALVEPCRPQLAVDVEDVVRMSSMRLRADLAVVHRGVDVGPGVLAERIPGADDLPRGRHLEHHLEAGVRNDDVACRAGPDVMDIVEAGE